jgi:hypothetical protein
MGQNLDRASSFGIVINRSPGIRGFLILVAATVATVALGWLTLSGT